ncbi:hypothetical protein [Enterovirga rhinocerotis]|uniref:hypothetical protein n=1 Tax=Enterovirga rhinocerotis TaxID=1339210 RepID=UPI00106212EE|nr:hypothetical protein [Enterovirga rhinocerotis]
MIWEAFTHRIDIAQCVLVALFAVPSAFRVTPIPEGNLPWPVLFALLSSFFGLRILLAPYWLWREEYLRAERALGRISAADGDPSGADIASGVSGAQAFGTYRPRPPVPETPLHQMIQLDPRAARDIPTKVGNASRVTTRGNSGRTDGKA